MFPVATGLHRFAHERLDYREHGQVLLGHRRQLGVEFDRLFGQRTDPAGEEFYGQVEKWDQECGQQGDADVRHEDERQCPEEGQSQRKEPYQCPGDEGCDTLYVASQQCQHFASAAFVVPGQGERLEVVVDAVAQAGEHFGTAVGQQIAVAETDQTLQSGNSKPDKQQGTERTVVQYLVCELARDPGCKEGEAAFREQQQQRQNQYFAVRCNLRHQEAETGLLG